MTLTLDNLMKAMAQLKAKDPLENEGVPKDYVCVIHPVIAQKLKEEFSMPSAVLPDITPPPMVLYLFDQLRQWTGRETFIIDAAPMDKVEYMPKLTMYAKYSYWFAARARLAQMQDEDSDNDQDRG